MISGTEQTLRGRLRQQVAMSRHTSWRAGGCADVLYQPADVDDLQTFLQQQPQAPIYLLGLGSNLLVRDGGVRGTVILLHGALTQLELQPDGLIFASAGVPGAKLARFAALHQKRGAAFCAGIPGTVGGMLAMNAGCYGSETWQHVVKVEMIGRDGQRYHWLPEQFEVAYRSVQRRDGKDWLLFTGAWFQFPSGDGQQARQEIKQLLTRRVQSQPLQLPNAGSVFRNPPGAYAAQLIEQCGLKGTRIGGAQVSEKHANFIVNDRGARAADIEQLIHYVQRYVQQKTGIQLQCEVRIIGENDG